MKERNSALKALAALIRKYPAVIIIKTVTIGANVVQTLIPVKIVEFIVNAYEEKIVSFDEIMMKVIMYLLLMLGAAALSQIMSFMMSYIDRNFKVHIAVSLYRKLKGIDYDFHENTKFLNNYTRALEQGPDYIYNCAIHQLDMLSMLFQSTSLFAVFFRIHPLSVLYALVIGLIYIFLKRKIGKLNYQLRSQQQPLMRRRNYYNRVFFLKDAMADLKTTEVEALLLSQHDEIGNGIISVYDRFALRRSGLEFIGSALVTSIFPIVLGIAVYLSVNLDIAAFSALTMAATTLSNLISRSVQVIADIETEAIECQATFRVLSMSSKIEGVRHPRFSESFRELSLDHVTFGYTETPVLHDISMSVKKGQKIAIIGANGAGKTTLVKLLLRLYDPQSGTVSVNGIPYTDIAPDDIRNIAGAVFQNPEVYSVTIGENVLLRKPKTTEDENLIIEALKFSGLYDYVSSLEEGINTLVTREFHRQGEIFSGGQMQKLAIARGYAQNYQLFILDEPSSALDPLAEADLYHNMLELGRDRTMIFISHRLSSTANADYIYLINNGEIEESGTHEELMALHGKYYEMFVSQSEKYLGGEENDEIII